VASFGSFDAAIKYAVSNLIYHGERVDTGRWQGVATEGKPDLVTREVINLRLDVNCSRGMWDEGELQDYFGELAQDIRPNLPWADEHFAERVGGRPLNPDPSHTKWPWWRGQDEATKNEQGKFTHTYSERFWPKHTDADWESGLTQAWRPNRGIRFPYGDYSDLLNLLFREPYTRQAYLPIFFPEDTGAVHRGRIPCTLGYHFLLRNKKLHMWYDIRSCDAVRHFRDDLYLAACLLAYTVYQLVDKELYSDTDTEQLWVDVEPGMLMFSCHSFHVHMGDYHLLREMSGE
jgi:hypothetical protein